MFLFWVIELCSRLITFSSVLIDFLCFVVEIFQGKVALLSKHSLVGHLL